MLRLFIEVSLCFYLTLLSLWISCLLYGYVMYNNLSTNKKLQDRRTLRKESEGEREKQQSSAINWRRATFISILENFSLHCSLCLCCVCVFFISCSSFSSDLLSHKFLALFAWHGSLNVFACHNFEPKFHYCACLPAGIKYTICISFLFCHDL